MDKTWVEINDDSHVMYNINSKIKFRITMSKSVLCDSSDAHILLKIMITITRRQKYETARQADEINKKVMFKSFAPFTNFISEINRTEIQDTEISRYCII